MTSDEERCLVLQLNEWLRERCSLLKPELFQKLRRCCICLGSQCADLGACRAEFARWGEKHWDRAVEKELERRHGTVLTAVFDKRRKCSSA